jgi:hypothetical protein
MLKVKVTKLVRNPAQPLMSNDPLIAQLIKSERTGQLLGLAPLGVDVSNMSRSGKINGVIVLMDDNGKLEEFELNEVEVMK